MFCVCADHESPRRVQTRWSELPHLDSNQKPFD